MQYIHNCTSHLSLYQNSRQACGVWQMDLNKIIFLELRVKSVKLISMCRWLCLFDPADLKDPECSVTAKTNITEPGSVYVSHIFSYSHLFFYLFHCEEAGCYSFLSSFAVNNTNFGAPHNVAAVVSDNRWNSTFFLQSSNWALSKLEKKKKH